MFRVHVFSAEGRLDTYEGHDEASACSDSATYRSRLDWFPDCNWEHIHAGKVNMY